ncbi:HNH endonuclease signature motif containing protein [Nocardia tengchongensis]|uniref:HNH endonuclease signature motif containing protein n=1 Tax=Nocardia tengchongensis TaxID=2055889 RepID=UPI003608A25F
MSECADDTFSAVEVVERLRVVHSMIAVAQAEEIALMAQLYRLRRAQQLALGVGALYAGEDAATEIGMAIKVSQRSADGSIALGLGLNERYRATREAFAEGRIDLPRARAISETLVNASDELLATVEPRIAAYAEHAEPQRVRRTLRRWLLEADPAGQAARRKSAEADRYVKVTAAEDGTALLEAVLPAAGGQTVYERLREMASTQCCGQDPRTTGQRRADALIALADGTGRLACRCGHSTCPRSDSGQSTPAVRKALVQVGVSAETLAGLQDNPALLAGFGAIDADLARQIARHAHFDIITDTDRPTADAAALRYRPRARVAARVRALDGTCRAPGCSVPAAATDLDHQDRFDHTTPESGGPTTEANLGCRCRRHHRLKTIADNGSNGWQVIHHPDRTVEWRSPSGGSVTTTPEGARFLFPRLPIPPVTAAGVPDAAAVEPLIDPGQALNAMTELVHVYCTPRQRRSHRQSRRNPPAIGSIAVLSALEPPF